MSSLKQYISAVSVICAVATLCCVAPALADGDPNEPVVETSVKTAVSVDAENTLRPDEQGALTEEAVATVTADGDFLLPTYLLPGETANVERTTTVEKVYERPQPVLPEVQEKAQVAVQVTEEPEDDLGALIQQAKASEEVVQLGQPNVQVQAQPEQYATDSQSNEKRQKKLLIPLAPVAAAPVADPELPAPERVVKHEEYANQMVGSLKTGEPLAFMMPHEMKITFYPKASSFSGQSLKWVKAFALAALEDPRLIVEVRASCAEADLQDKRLKLVKDALKGAGLSTHQIVVNYTNRPVDTMLLRAVPRVEAEELVVTQKDQKLPKNMSQVRKW